MARHLEVIVTTATTRSHGWSYWQKRFEIGEPSSGPGGAIDDDEAGNRAADNRHPSMGIGLEPGIDLALGSVTRLKLLPRDEGALIRRANRKNAQTSAQIVHRSRPGVCHF